MRRPLLKASPAALRRAAELYRPFDRPPIAPKPKVDADQPDPKVEAKDDNPKNQ